MSLRSFWFVLPLLGAVAAPAAEPPAAAGEPGRVQLIFLLPEVIDLPTAHGFAKRYMRYGNAQVQVLMRIQNHGAALKQTLSFCETERFPYVITAASSDYVAEPLALASIYRDLEREVLPILASDLCRGAYLHELFAWHATQLKSWRPQDVATGGLDWAWLDRLAAETARRGKVVYWSDGGLSWRMPQLAEPAARFFERRGRHIVPLFATNFLGSFRENAVWSRRLAARYGLRAVGISVQDWHFIAQQNAGSKLREKKITYESLGISAQKTLALLAIGRHCGCRVFQIEGTQEGLHPESAFMRGVASFVRHMADHLPAPVPSGEEMGSGVF